MATAPDKITVRAQAKYVGISARKARVVLEHVRGRSVPEARTVLAFTQRAAARDIEKVLHSAVSNAEANHGLIGDELVVHAAFADEGPTLKRWRARARGRVNRIRKRSCHITVILEPAARESLAGRRRVRTEEKTDKPNSEASASAPKASKRKEAAV